MPLRVLLQDLGRGVLALAKFGLESLGVRRQGKGRREAFWGKEGWTFSRVGSEDWELGTRCDTCTKSGAPVWCFNIFSALDNATKKKWQNVTENNFFLNG